MILALTKSTVWLYFIPVVFHEALSILTCDLVIDDRGSEYVIDCFKKRSKSKSDIL